MKSVWELFVKPADGDESLVETKKPAARASTASVPTAPVVVSSLSAPSPVPAAAPQSVDPDMVAKLKTAMLSDGNNSVDRFLAVFDSLAGIIPDENTRFLAAIKSAASQGLSADAVLADVLSDEQILVQKEAEFAQVVEQQRKSALGGKQTQMEAAAAEIAKKQAEIAAAQEVIRKLEAGQTALQEQTAADARHINEVEGRFKVTLAAVRGGRKTLEEKLRPHCTQKGQ